MTEPVTLTSGALEVVLEPNNGADITAVLDRPSGINVLFQASWRNHTARIAEYTADSMSSWMSTYRGGWQILAPNAGDERVHDGVTQGYHGEAALAQWDLVAQSDSRVELRADLLTAPLAMCRIVSVEGATLTVTNRVRNTSPDPVSFRWVEHPAFGAPFLDGDAYLDTTARTLVTDPDAPGNLLPAGQIRRFPTDEDGLDLGTLPGPDSGRALFGALTGFNEGLARVVSPNAGFAMCLRWDSAVFGHAWFWQECHATGGFPWYRRAYVCAVEPANILPGEADHGGRLHGRARPISGHDEIETSLTLTREALPHS